MTVVPSKLFPDFPESFFSNTADSKDFLFAVASEFGQCFYSSSEQASFCSGRHSRLHNRNRWDVIADKPIFFSYCFLSRLDHLLHLSIFSDIFPKFFVFRQQAGTAFVLIKFSQTVSSPLTYVVAADSHLFCNSGQVFLFPIFQTVILA